MKILKLPSVQVNTKIVLTYYLVMNGEGMILITETARRGELESCVGHKDRPKNFYASHTIDSLDVWPELKTPELLSYIEWVMAGKNMYEHTHSGPVSSCGDGSVQWGKGALHIDPERD
jgi:hypothetical protein